MSQLRTVAAVASAALLVALAACVPTPAGEPPVIASAVASQAQATPDFDAMPYAIDDADALAELTDVIVEHSAFGEQVDETVGAPGSRSTSVTYVTDDGVDVAIRFTLHDDSTPFQHDVDALVSAWRTSGDFPLAVP